MRRLFFAIAVVVYMLSSMGWVLDIHYCMGKVDAVHLFEKEKSSCGTCGMAANESEGCCHDEAAFVKLIQDQKPPVTLHFNLQPAVFTLLSTSFQEILPDFFLVASSATFSTAPPGEQRPLFIRHRVFRI